MRFQKLNTNIKVKNYDEICSSSKSSEKNRHSDLLPSLVRGIITGSSGCGKTNALLCLIEHPLGIKFENIYIYTKSIFQPKYQYLKKIIDSIPEIGFYEFSTPEDILPPSQIKPNSIVIFDDISTKTPNHIIQEYFAMGRHNLLDVFFICQTYSSIPKQLIRDNANLLILFKQDGKNLRHVFDNHVSPDMSFEEFSALCNACWKNKHDFLVLNKDRDIKEGRYIANFNSKIIL